MISNLNIEEATIIELQKALEDGSITSKDLVLLYLERIAKYDKNGPRINSVLEINPDVIHIAEALDYERKTSGSRSMLHGIPVLIKDNIDTNDRMHTSAGSLALANSYAQEDAFIVKKLRESGAIILGKSNMTEFANFMTEGMPSGYSSRGGQVLNPYGPNKFCPGGSSAGSGASVSSNFCTCAIGTETSGSILSPSAENSIVGIKPTLGLISRSGIIPIAHSQDTAGPMARTVSDAAILLGAITGVDHNDPVTLASKEKSYKDYTQFLDSNGLKGATIGIPRDYYYEKLSEDEMAIMNEAIEVLKTLGANIIDPVNIETARQFESYNVLTYEFKSDMNYYLSKLDPKSSIKTLGDIIVFNSRTPSQTLKYGQSILIESENTSGTLTEPEYINDKIKDLHLSRDKGIDATMEKFNLDAILFPSTAGCDIAARAGYPSITVPGGYLNDGLPFGITFTAKAYSEPTLIKFAYSYEQATKKRVSPKW